MAAKRTELKLFRIKKDMTQEQFAEKLGYSRMHYSQIENGKREVPLKMLNALAEFGGITLDDAKEITKKDNE